MALSTVELNEDSDSNLLHLTLKEEEDWWKVRLYRLANLIFYKDRKTPLSNLMIAPVGLFGF